MHSIFLFICFIVGSIAEESDSSEAKYIDLLPESEKKEFLHKIAKRIFEEVQSKGGKHASGEISDAQLDVHNEYVSKLLEEESKNLRKNAEKGTEDKNDSAASEKVKESKLSSNEADDRIDLTLREEKRGKRNKSEEETSKEDKVPNKISETNEDNKSQDNTSVEIEVKHKNEKESDEDESSTTKLREDEIPVKILYDDEATTNKAEDVKRSIENSKELKGILRTRKYASRENEESATKIVDFSPEESKDEDIVEAIIETTTIENIPSTLATTVQTSTDIVTVADNPKLDGSYTQRIYEAIDTEESASDNESVNANAKLSHEKSSYEETQGISLVETEANGKKDIKQDTITTSEDNQKNITQTDKTKKFKKALRSKVNIDENDDEIITTSKRNTELLTTDNPDIDNLSSVETSSKNPVENVKSSLEALTVMSGKPKLEAVQVLSDISTAKTNLTELKNDTNKLEEVSGKKEALRHGFFESSAETQIEDSQLFQKIKSRYDDGKVKPYEVFEVKPDKPQFVNLQHKLTEVITEDLSPNKEHPYHVPVYNYAPKNAYFNPYNHLGPNIEDLDSEINESFEKSSNLRVLYKPPKSYLNDALLKQLIFDKRHKVHYSRYKSYKSMPKPKRPKYVNNNPDDPDIDYYFSQNDEVLRNHDKLNRKSTKLVKNTESEERKAHHPYHFVHDDDGYKNNFSAIRQLLYEKGRFGYVSEKTSSTTTKRPRTRTVCPKATTVRTDNLVTKTTTKTPQEELELPSILRTDYDNDYPIKNFYPKAKLKDPNQNIAVDYYFGSEAERKSKMEVRTALRELWNQITDENFTSTTTTTTVRPKITNEDIKMIMDMSDPADLLLTLDKLLSIKRSRDDLQPYLKVMGDMIRNDDKALNQYDWLRTVVEVRSAVQKLSDLSQRLQSYDRIHPADKQLLKYVMYLHKSTRNNLRRSALTEDMSPFLSKLILERGRLPRNKNHHHKAMSSTKGLLERIWLRVMEMTKGSNQFEDDIREFDKFLNNLQSGLYNLHDAIKHIALITKYNNQRWYLNLKELYLSRASRRDLLSVLLHVSTARLVSLIEESSTKGLEDDYLKYVSENERHVKKTKGEFYFVLKILDAIEKYDD